MSMLTLESQLGRHDCSCLRSQRNRPPFGVICTQAKMCIELIGWDAEASAAEGRREPLSFEAYCTSLARCGGGADGDGKPLRRLGRAPG